MELGLAGFEVVQGIFVFAFGLCVGSFLNVVIVRLPRGRSLISPGSRCGFCRSALVWHSNIPILGFLKSAGQCQKCGHPYSVRYLLIELLTALLFLAVWAQYGWSEKTILISAFVGALIAMTFIDLEFRIIPDSISLGGWFVALVFAALQVPDFPLSLSDAIIGSAVGYGFFWIASRVFYWKTQEVGLGEGDVKLMGFIGAFVGFSGVLTTILVGSILGVAVGLTLMLVQGKGRRYPIPFGPFLALGALVSIFGLDFWWVH